MDEFWDFDSSATSRSVDVYMAKIREKTADCNGCNLCRAACPLKAISSGVPDGRCIRCLKCVDACPRKALQVKIGWPLKLYLRKKKYSKLRIYV